MRSFAAATALALAGALAATAQESKPPSGDVLPPPAPPSKAQIGYTHDVSTPDFPAAPKPPAGAPNVVIVLLDDVGFGQAGTFGGPVPTPTLDRLAKEGLRYNCFHTTALCSPTRAALLTGRNHHAAHTGAITEIATGYPGYDSVIPASTAMIAEILRAHGYGTAAFGKWHNTPDWETSGAGPFDRWPTGMGFEQFYGFLGGETNQWAPALVENTKAIEPPHAPGYHFMADMTDRAIAWIGHVKAIAPEKPFFVYFAPGACHAPHHAPKEWIAKFKGKFDQGWDQVREETLAREKQLGVVPQDTVLTPRPEEIKPWADLRPEERRLYARMQEVFAAYLAYADHEIGRLLDAIDAQGERENTLVFYIVGDNGPSGEGGLPGSVNENKFFNGEPESLEQNLTMIGQLGGPETYNHYPAGWANAGATPFRWMKQVASHFGGTRNPLVVSWPKRIHDAGGLRAQFHHVIDVAPTILEASGIAAPAIVNGVAQRPIDGVSMLSTFDDPSAPGRHHTQYFEMFENRAIYHDGWIASCFHGRLPWDPIGAPHDPNADTWELYDIEHDFSQAADLAAKEPKKLRELEDLFMIEAAKNDVFPLDDRGVARFAEGERPSLAAGRTKFVYRAPVEIPDGSAPNLKNKSASVTAEVEIPKEGAVGVLLSDGGRFGGFSFFVAEGRLQFAYNFLGEKVTTIRSTEKIPTGRAVTLGYIFASDGGKPGAGGTVRLTIDGRPAGEGRIERTIPNVLSIGGDGFAIGADPQTPVTDAYESPFAFTGALTRVSVELAAPGTTTAPAGAPKEEK
jgi:arylsulfatase